MLDWHLCQYVILLKKSYYYYYQVPLPPLPKGIFYFSYFCSNTEKGHLVVNFVPMIVPKNA